MCLCLLSTMGKRLCLKVTVRVSHGNTAKLDGTEQEETCCPSKHHRGRALWTAPMPKHLLPPSSHKGQSGLKHWNKIAHLLGHLLRHWHPQKFAYTVSQSRKNAIGRLGGNAHCVVILPIN